MPKKTIQLLGQELNMSYGILYNTKPNDIAKPFLADHIHKSVNDEGKINFSIRKSKNRLWITGQQIIIGGVVDSKHSLKEWTAGFLQAIIKSERISKYVPVTGGFGAKTQERIVRLKSPSGEPLKDGDDNSLFYPGTESDMVAGNARVELRDGPNFQMPLETDMGQLRATSGYDEFSSHFVLVHKETKSIVDLARVSWKVDWSGRYLGTQLVWKPTKVPILSILKTDEEPKIYANIQKNTQLPFSLDLNEAEKYCEIKNGNSNWSLAKISSGEQIGGQMPAKRSWLG